MNKRIFLTFYLIVFVLYPCMAQQPLIYGQGKLSSNLITKIIQDSSGFIWIGTENGLNKFDGWKFTHYFNKKNDPTSLAGNSVETFMLDKDGSLWIAMNGGLQYYRPEDDHFISIEFPNKITPSVKDIIQLHSGEIWIVTAGYGVFSIDKSALKALYLTDINESIKNKYAVRIFQDQNHNIWIGLSGNKITKISADRKEIQIYQLPIDSRHKIFGMVEDDSGRLYVATSTNVFLWDSIRQEFIFVNNEKNEIITIRGIKKLNDGRIYIHTIGQGIKYIDTDSMTIRTSYNFPTGSTNPIGERITAIFDDKDGNLWLGYYKKGLSVKLNEPIFFDFWDLSTIKNDEAHYTAFMDGCNLLLGTEQGKLLKLNNKGCIDKSWQLPVDISILFQDSKETLWVGSYSNGLGTFDKHTGLLKSIPQFANKFITAIEEGHNNDMYVSVFGEGFMRYNSLKKQWISISDKVLMENTSRLSNNWIGDILCDSDGYIWLAQSTGVDCFDPENNIFLDFSNLPELRSYGAIVLLEDKMKNIWIGSKNGLIKYNKNDNLINYYGIEDGLPNNVICDLGTDSKGNIWGSTLNGLFQLDVKDDRIASYFTGNGLVDKEYFKGITSQNNDCYIYFTGLHGITRFIPDSIQPLQLTYQPILTNLYINNVLVSGSTKLNNKRITDTKLTDATEIYLTYREKTFSLEFSPMNFHNTENIIFEHRLLPLNRDWSKTFPGENRITFNSLSPGEYILEVRTFENNTYSLTKSLSIQINPPWYISGWAILLYIIFFTVVIIIGLILFFSHRANRQEKLNNQEKLKFFINIAHEIRSPLTLITSPLYELSKRKYDNDTSFKLQTIQRNADRIMNLMNQLLDIRKIDMGQMKICCKETNIVDYIKELLLVFDHQSSKRNISLLFESEITYLPVWIDHNNFDKVLMNLLMNAFRFTPDGGQIIINLQIITKKGSNKKTSPYVEIQIIDSGMGLIEKDINKLFEHFYQTSPHSSIGYGIGLNLANLIVKLHHGTIHASNRINTQGSCFTVHLPLGRKLLKNDEISKEKQSRHSFFDPNSFNDGKLTNAVISNSNARKNLLVVDDDEEIREYLKRELAHTYKIFTVESGEGALKVLLRKRIDLIISDIKMPEMNGFELLKKIRSNNNISHIPVILLTSQVEFKSRMEGWNVGADGFINKPFLIEELLVLCENLINSRSLLKGKFTGINELEEKVTPIDVKSNDDLFIEKLMYLINQNLDNSCYSVELLAKDIGLSRSQLHRKLKDLTGISTSDFIRNVRLKQAAKLLLEKKVNISQVAYATGFTNPTIFSVSFKKFYGYTPKEFIIYGSEKNQLNDVHLIEQTTGA